MYKSIVTKKWIVDWKLRTSIKNSEKGNFLEKNQGIKDDLFHLILRDFKMKVVFL